MSHPQAAPAGGDVGRRVLVHLHTRVVGGGQVPAELGDGAHDVGRAAGDPEPVLASVDRLPVVVGDGVRAHLQRVDVEELVAGQRHPAQETVEQQAFHRVGVGDVAGREQLPPGPLHCADRRAGLGVRDVRGQLVRVAERFAVPPRAQAAGEVLLGGGHRRPLPGQRRAEPGIAAFGRDVGRTGREVHRPHRVAFRDARLAHRDAVGEVDRLASVPADRAVAAGGDEVLGEVEVALLAALAVQLDECHLDHRMSVQAGVAVRAEGRGEVVGRPQRDLPQRAVAEQPVRGDRSLQQMTEAVVLVAHHQVGVAVAPGAGDLHVAVDVPVVVLRARDGLAEQVELGPQVIGVDARALPRHGLQPLVDVGVHEPRPAVGVRVGSEGGVGDGGARPARGR